MKENKKFAILAKNLHDFSAESRIRTVTEKWPEGKKGGMGWHCFNFGLVVTIINKINLTSIPLYHI
jgi:hypothetical protein